MPLKFKKILIDDQRFESAGIMDVNQDGHLDIVSGSYWYEGPGFVRRHIVARQEPHNVEYFDDFSTIPLDVNGNGRPDVITGGWFGDRLRWLENPRETREEWRVHELEPIGHIETTRAWDIDGDGVLEIIPNTPNDPLRVFKLVTDSSGKGTGEFEVHLIREAPQEHGLGCGDIAGNGRMDIVLREGWLEAPEDTWDADWIWHPELPIEDRASVPILVVDITGNGVNDLIVGSAHDYGLDWVEHKFEAGEHRWVRHPIDPYNSQYHDMKWIDIDCDGEYELVTGKRYRAHSGTDPGAHDDYGIYYFKWTGENFVKEVVDYGPKRETTGLGIHFDMADMTGNGFPDIVAPGKDGLYLYINEGAEIEGFKY